MVNFLHALFVIEMIELWTCLITATLFSLSDTSKSDDQVKPTTLNYEEADAGPSSQGSRKSRFAALAQHINDFEDDLSHPTIQ